MAKLHISFQFPCRIWNIFLLLNGKSIFKLTNFDVIWDKSIYPFCVVIIIFHFTCYSFHFSVVVKTPIGDLPMFREDISLEFCVQSLNSLLIELTMYRHCISDKCRA